MLTVRPTQCESIRGKGVVKKKKKKTKTLQFGQKVPVPVHIDSGVTLLEGARGQGMAGCPIDMIKGFHVTSYQANFANHPTCDHHVGFLLHGQV